MSSLLLVDHLGERARTIAAAPSRIALEAKQLDVGRTAELAPALRHCDVVINATLPKHNLSVMRACLESGADYLDTAGAGPLPPTGRAGILAQLDLHEDFRRAGRAALISMGLDPGLTNVLAREAADRLDVVHAIRIRSGGTAKVPNFADFPLYSREGFLEDARIRPTVWEHGSLDEREPLSDEEDFEFPPPVGMQHTFLMSHEEVKTLPKFLGKPVERVDFKYALNPHLVRAVLALGSLGFLDERKMIRLQGLSISFRHVLLEVLPEPSALLLPLEGAKAVVTVVEGLKGGSPVVLRSHIVMTHREANRRRGTTAVHYLTAVGATIGVDLLLDRALPGPGVYPPEVLDPRRVLQALAARDITVVRSDVPPAPEPAS